MKDITINFNVGSPYVSVDEYSRLSDIPVNTVRRIVNNGDIIIRPKKYAKEKIQINMIAMLKDTIRNS